MFTKTTVCVFACSLVSAMSADTHVWKDGAAGGWNDPASYADNTLPEADDIVQIPAGVVVTAGDDDIALISSLKTVMFGGATSKLIFDVAGDHEIECSICGTENGNKQEGSGIVEKNGAGMIWLKNYSSLYNYYAHIVVNQGILRLQAVSHSNRNQYYRSLTVNHPGVLYTTVNNETPAKTVHFRGVLYGDGLVTNPSPNEVVFYIENRNADSIPDFSGRLGGKIGIGSPDDRCYQNFSGTGSINPSDISITYKMSLGLADLGGTGGDGEKHYGSFGHGDVVFAGEGVLRYTGRGGVSYTRFEDNDKMQFAHIDAGAYGGLRLLGRFAFDQSNLMLKRLILSGENANACTIEGNMYNRHSGAVYLTKKGSGTWSLASETAFSNGVVAVENGTLRFISIRNKGRRCSLGGATILRAEHTGALADAAVLPYAYLLGTRETTGTMEYVGADDAVCDDRAFAVNGSGRITSSGGALVLSGGAGTVTPGVNVLYLGGSAQNCVMNNITNGVGTLKVVKEGAGDWSIGGNLDFTGGIHVKAGGLAIGNDYQVGNYSYYRLTIREKNMSGSGNSYFTIGRLALFNEDGKVQNMNLSYNPDANSNGGRSQLEPGQFAYTFTAGKLSPNGFFNHKDSDGVQIDMPMYNATNIFAALDANVEAFARFRHISREGTSWWPGLADGDYWPSIDFRLPAGTGKIVSYDIGARYGSAAKTDETKTAEKKNWMDIVGSWTLYGSVDGENWTELSSVTSNDLRGVATADCSWLYDGASYKTEEGWRRETSGWTIASRPAGGHEVAVSQFVGGMGKVAVDAGATLRAKGDYTIDELELGTENGTFDGFAFASAGTLHANVSEVSGPLDLNAVFVNCTGLSNLKNWRVVSDGGILHVIEIGEDGVKVATCGLRVLVR